jgi:hypothetical protein
MRIRAQLCRFAITAEMPEWNEIECPMDFNSADTGRSVSNPHSLANAELQPK